MTSQISWEITRMIYEMERMLANTDKRNEYGIGFALGYVHALKYVETLIEIEEAKKEQ